MEALDALRKACGDGAVRHPAADSADSFDSVDGVAASYVAQPATTEAVSELLRASAEHDLAAVPRGAGTKLDWGSPPRRADLLIDLSTMDKVVEHAAGDLVVRVQPGVRLADLQQALAPAGQRLAVDEVVPGSTVGGVIATGLSGPTRLLHGGVRDLLIGVTVVRADGTVTRSGGKVVKNVAGYDLGKLYTGSYGTLGVVTEAIFRLHPVPDERAYVSITAATEEELQPRLSAILGSQLVPAAVEVERAAPDTAVTATVLLEGAGVQDRAAAATKLIGGSVSPDQPDGWAGYVTAPVVVRATAEISGVSRLLADIRRGAQRHGVDASVRGSAGAGALYVNLAGDEPARAAAFVRDLRGAAATQGGTAVVLRAPAAVKAAVDVWGPVHGLELMRRVKDQFDLDQRLSPGRFVGGI